METTDTPKPIKLSVTPTPVILPLTFKFCAYPGNHPEEIRNVLKESLKCEEIPHNQEDRCLRECNLIWKPLEMSFKALSIWDSVTKQNNGS